MAGERKHRLPSCGVPECDCVIPVRGCKDVSDRTESDFGGPFFLGRRGVDAFPGGGIPNVDGTKLCVGATREFPESKIDAAGVEVRPSELKASGPTMPTVSLRVRSSLPVAASQSLIDWS